MGPPPASIHSPTPLICLNLKQLFQNISRKDGFFLKTITSVRSSHLKRIHTYRYGYMPSSTIYNICVEITQDSSTHIPERMCIPQAQRHACAHLHTQTQTWHQGAVAWGRSPGTLRTTDQAWTRTAARLILLATPAEVEHTRPPRCPPPGMPTPRDALPTPRDAHPLPQDAHPSGCPPPGMPTAVHTQAQQMRARNTLAAFFSEAANRRGCERERRATWIRCCTRGAWNAAESWRGRSFCSVQPRRGPWPRLA